MLSTRVSRRTRTIAARRRAMCCDRGADTRCRRHRKPSPYRSATDRPLMCLDRPCSAAGVERRRLAFGKNRRPRRLLRRRRSGCGRHGRRVPALFTGACARRVVQMVPSSRPTLVFRRRRARYGSGARPSNAALFFELLLPRARLYRRAGGALPTAKILYQHGAGDEPADVRHESDAAARLWPLAEDTVGADQLEDEPQAHGDVAGTVVSIRRMITRTCRCGCITR